MASCYCVSPVCFHGPDQESILTGILAVWVSRVIARCLDSQQPGHAMHCCLGKEPVHRKNGSPFSFDEPQCREIGLTTMESSCIRGLVAFSSFQPVERRPPAMFGQRWLLHFLLAQRFWPASPCRGVSFHI